MCACLVSLSIPFWAAAPKGRCPVGHRGEFPDVRPYVRPSIRPSPPEAPLRSQISPLGPQISPLRPNIRRLRPKIRPPRLKTQQTPNGKCHGSTACLRARLSANLRWPKLQIQHYKRIKWFKDIHNYPVYNFKPFFVTLPTPRGYKNLFRGLFLACLHSVSYKK